MARIMNTLSATAVRAATYQGKIIKLFDGGGLFLHVTEKGKYWRLKYRYGGKEKLLALGVYPRVSLQAARQGRDKARELLAQGIEPSAYRRASKAAQVEAAMNTFKFVAREWYETVHRHKVVPGHAARNLRRLDRYVFPLLGHRPLGDITPSELLGILRRIEQTGHTETAHRVKNLCGQIFRYAISTGRAERDIAADLRDALRPVERKHYPALIQPEEIAPLLRAIDRYGGNPATCAALKLAPLLFVRPGELRQAEWKDFNLATGEWHYTPSKGGYPLILPLPQQAIAIVRQMERLSGGERYVFTARGNRPLSENTVNQALHRLGYKGIMTGHGFRAMARTVLAERLNFPPEYIEQQLAHVVRDANGRAYNRTTHLEQRRHMLQTWADYLDVLKGAKNNRATMSDLPLRAAK